MSTLRRHSLATLLALSSLLAATEGVGGPTSAGPAPADVQKAISSGAEWLRQQHRGGFVDERRDDVVEVVVLTLQHCGSNFEDKVYAKGVALLEKEEPRFTYRASLQAMALVEVNPRLYQGKIANCAQWLIDTQLPGGEWGYPGTPNGSGFLPQGVKVAPVPPPAGTKPGEPVPPRPKVLLDRRGGATLDASALKGDFSNTQLAILALRSCREAGVEAPKATWSAAYDYLKKFQHADGGFGYVMQGVQDEGSYASLTAAAAASAAICANALGSKDPKGDPVVKKALQWLDKNLDMTANAGIEKSSVSGPSPWQYYNLYSVERTGRILGLDTVGKHAWYPEGAKVILAAQQGDGHWEDGELSGGRRPSMTVADTCFALLFLTRATRPLTGG